MNKIISYSKARQNLASVMDEACTSRAPITVTRRGRDPVVIMSLEEYNAMDETTHLMRSPANAAHLRRGLEAYARDEFVEHDLIEPGMARKLKHRKARPTAKRKASR
jgi:antitoxin YefM